MRKKLTDRAIAGLTPPRLGRLEVFDLIFPGFGVRVTANGRKTFMLMYRITGRLRRLTLGRYPALTLAKAREKAGKALSLVERGSDPADEKMVRRAAGGESFGDVVAEYFATHAMSALRSAHETRRLIERDCAHWIHRPVQSISRRDVRDLLDGIVARGSPVMANRLRAYLAGFFSWSVAREVLEVSPVAGVPKPATERPRDRVLTDPELTELWTAAGTLGYPFGEIVQMLILTGQRRGEVAAMRWVDLDLESDKPLWSLPADATKNGRPHTVPLASRAVAILGVLPRLSGPLVFSTRDGTVLFAGWSKYRTKLDAALMTARRNTTTRHGAKEIEPMSPWTLHDIRRSTASGMARLGFPPHVVERVLNHSSGVVSGMAAIYNRHDYSGEARAALNGWGRHVEALLEPATNNIVALRGALATKAN
jgi:integrase